MKLLLPLALCALLPLSWAGQTMVFIADDLSGLTESLASASNAALATDDTPIVLIIKDTQVSQALKGSAATRDLRDAHSSNVKIFICEVDLVRYGFSNSKVLAGIAIAKAPALTSEPAEPPAAEARPLERFIKQAEKVCNQ
jgi:intracellular sulfur oxidation DsrE/DsrF family protein